MEGASENADKGSTLVDLGALFRQKRISLGLTIENVANEISIRTLFLQCIEEGRISELPGGVYTAGFIKNYAQFIGIDSNIVQAMFDLISAPQKTREKRIDPHVLVTPALWSFSWTTVCYGILAAFALIWFLVLPNPLNLSEIFNAIQIPPAQKQEPQKLSTTQKEIAERNSENTVMQNEICLRADGETWIKITNENNELVHTQMMRTGSQLDLTPFDDHFLTAGDGRQLVVCKNNEEIIRFADIMPSDNAPALIENMPITLKIWTKNR